MMFVHAAYNCSIFSFETANMDCNSSAEAFDLSLIMFLRVLHGNLILPSIEAAMDQAAACSASQDVMPAVTISVHDASIICRMPSKYSLN